MKVAQILVMEKKKKLIILINRLYVKRAKLIATLELQNKEDCNSFLFHSPNSVAEEPDFLHNSKVTC